MKRLFFIGLAIIVISGCNSGKKQEIIKTPMQQKIDQYAVVKLTTDISKFSDKEKQLLSLFIDIAQIMDDIYWEEAIGGKEKFLAGITDEDTRKFALINYGPWDKLDNNKPFISSYKERPLGENFYPADMTKEEFEKFDSKDKTSQYTIIKRNPDGSLKTVPYHIAFEEKIKKAAELLKQAAGLADDPGLKNYLNLRAEALLTDDYFNSDMAWMDMKNTKFDLVAGPIENYDDALFGYKTAHEACVVVKDIEWSKKLEKFASFLPELQKGLPVEPEYKAETPGFDSDMNVYDAVYYAGDCNGGSKTIAINLPNDERVQLTKGTRKLQLKNSMKAKFDNILVPIANVLIDESQRKYIKFNAFFENTMFHEVAHGMGIKNTINGKLTVREALKEQYGSIEEGKADIFGLYLVTKFYEKGELTEGELMDNYVTFFASTFRSIRFGAASAHGKANMMRFNFFEKEGAFTRNSDGTYKVNFDIMKKAVVKLMQETLHVQGNGDYEAAKKWVEGDGIIKAQLQSDLNRLEKENIPVDIVFEQGKEVLGIK